MAKKRKKSTGKPLNLFRKDGFVPLRSYGVLGDGRSIALTAGDGSIDWWCVPTMDSPPLFDRILTGAPEGFFSIRPAEKFRVKRRYRKDSNVLETLLVTESAVARITESLNSGPAGRLPWSELARRIECLEGEITFRVELSFGHRAGTINPYFSKKGKRLVFHAERILGLFLHGRKTKIIFREDGRIRALITLRAGEKETVGIVAGKDEPLVVPHINELDHRIETSHDEWKQWVATLKYHGAYREVIFQNALVLKLLLSSPDGAIAAAATTSLPEKIGGSKNYDYRFAWVRDAAYTIRAFLRIGALSEGKAAFTWLLKRLAEKGPRVCYTLRGDAVPGQQEIPVQGYRGSQPVVMGNRAGAQFQLGVFGDIFQTACHFVKKGGILDGASAQTLAELADYTADQWQKKDSGIWELVELQHYTNSKISAWQALARAVELADEGQLPTTCRDRWFRERDRIKDWIEKNCWSEKLQAYEFFPGSGKLDCSISMAVRFGFENEERLARTLDALDKHLSAGVFHYRYTGMAKEEGCFLACSFWICEARSLLGQNEKARADFEELLRALKGGLGVISEMIDPQTGAFLGNLPQGLTHLALIQAAATIDGAANEP